MSFNLYNAANFGAPQIRERVVLIGKRGGGRVAGKPHIAPAEEYAVNELEAAIKRGLS